MDGKEEINFESVVSNFNEESGCVMSKSSEKLVGNTEGKESLSVELEQVVKDGNVVLSEEPGLVTSTGAQMEPELSNETSENESAVSSTGTSSTDTSEMSMAKSAQHESDMSNQGDEDGSTMSPIDIWHDTTEMGARDKTRLDPKACNSVAESESTFSSPDIVSKVYVESEDVAVMSPGVSCQQPYSVAVGDCAFSAVQDPRYTMILVEQLQENGEYEKALDLCEDAVNLLGSDVGNHHMLFCNNIMQLQCVLNRPQEAINVYENCAPFLDPQTVDAKVIQSMVDICVTCKKNLKINEN